MRRTTVILLLIFVSPLLGAPPPRLPEVPPVQVGLDADFLKHIDEVVESGLSANRMPGCVVLVARQGKIAFYKAYGYRSLLPQKEPMTRDTVFDMASITKPVATATSIMLLVERGVLRLGDRLADHVPNYLPEIREGVTIQQLLTHTAGFIPDNPISDYDGGADRARERLFHLSPTAPGTRFVYSDVGFELLGELLRIKTGKNVAAFARSNVFDPLGMNDTMFLPGEPLKKRAAVTQTRDGRWMRGEVHDPRAYALGGVAGHAGLFSTAEDLAVYAQMLHDGGTYSGVRILGERTVRLMTSPQILPGGAVRTLGWDMQSGFSSNRGETFSKSAFGHGGYTGTVLWIDPELELTVIFLSNRVHPDGKGSVNPLAGRVGAIAASAILQKPRVQADVPAKLLP